MRRFVRRQWPVLLFVAAALVATWFAYDYLIDFRPPDVPFVVTPNDVVEQMLDLAELKPSDFVVDLGSGDGRVLIAAGRRGAKSLGIEIDPEWVAKSRAAIRSAGLDRKAKVVRGDIFREDFTDADVVTMFLKIDVNLRLRPQFEKLKPGTRIVSHMWSMPGAKPAKSRVVHSSESQSDHAIYLWITPIVWE